MKYTIFTFSQWILFRVKAKFRIKNENICWVINLFNSLPQKTDPKSRTRTLTCHRFYFLCFVSESLVNGAVAPPSRHGVLEEDARRLRDTISRFVLLRVDHTEFACLKALVLFKAGASQHHTNKCPVAYIPPREISHRGRVVNISYSGGLGFRYRPGDRLHWPRGFVVLLSTSRRIPEYYLKIRPRPLLSKSFPIHHLLAARSLTLYS
jgi:hypothetical protein